MKKRILAFSMMIVAMVCSSLPVVAETTYTDYVVEDEALFADNFGLMQGYEDGTFRPNNPITRAEFASSLVKAAEKAYPNTQPASISFSDLDKSNWAYETVAKAVSLGFINGFEDGTFRPYDNVTYEQAVAMIFNLLGYKPVADMYGGYPHAYVSLAYYNRIFDAHIENRKGTLEMDEVKQKTAMTRSDALKMLSDALLTPICVVTGTETAWDGSETPIYSLGGDGTVMQTLYSLGNVKYLQGDEIDAELKEHGVTVRE